MKRALICLLALLTLSAPAVFAQEQAQPANPPALILPQELPDDLPQKDSDPNWVDAWSNVPEAAPELPLEQDTLDGMLLSGLRLDALIQLNQPLVVEKNGLLLTIPLETLAELNVGTDSQLLVELFWADLRTPVVTALLDGEPVTNLAESTLKLSWKGAALPSVEGGQALNLTNGVLTLRLDAPGAYPILRPGDEPPTPYPADAAPMTRQVMAMSALAGGLMAAAAALLLRRS